MKKLIKYSLLFLIGGTIYITIEVLWRRLMSSNPTHWSMFILGGLCFLLVGAINEFFLWDTPIWIQSLGGTIIIVILEFIFGCVLNLWLKLNIWDYSNTPFNILGQVCLPFAAAWYVLSMVAIFIDDWLRYWLFNEEKPHYNWHFSK